MFELLILAVLIPALLTVPEWAQRDLRRWLRRCGRHLRARIRGYTMLLVVFVVLLQSMGYTAFSFPVHASRVDESALLFGAETFAAGNLTNPTHPQADSLIGGWFQGFLIQRPSWQMKYPPGQSFVLALGILMGDAYYGVLVSCIVAMSSLYWLLRSILRRRWALFALWLALFNWLMVQQWLRHFDGGHVAMFGGCLVYGALFRLLRRPVYRDGVLFGIGCIVLAYTRPWEGFFACLPAALVLLWRVCFGGRKGVARMDLLKRGLTPATLVLAAGLCWLGYYHLAVTGDAFRMPYVEWNLQTEDQRFGSMGQLVSITGDVIRWISNGRKTVFEVFEFLMRSRIERSWRTLAGLISPLGMLAMYGLFFRRGSRELCLVILVVTTVSCIVLLEKVHWYPAIYFAPIVGLLFFLMGSGIRGLQRLRFGDRRIGATLTGLMPLLIVLSFLTHAVRTIPSAKVSAHVRQLAAIEQQLQEEGGEHLVLVRYNEQPTYTTEWITNSPSIDSQHIVWAQVMCADRDRALLQYYADRKIWLLRPQAETAVLTKVSGETDLLALIDQEESGQAMLD